MPSGRAESLKQLYRGWTTALAARPDMPLDEVRELFEHWGDVTAEPRGVDYIEADAGGVPAMWARPKNCQEDRVLLCTHGGGYVTGSIYTHRKMFAHIAKKIGCKALIVDYRRAPENIHPGPVNDVVRAYGWLLGAGILPRHIGFVGDSAGGGLVVTTMLRAREQGLPLPAAAIPLSPWLDMEAQGKTFESNADKDLLVSRPIIQLMASIFLGEGGNPHDGLANPLLADLAGLPPMLIQVGGNEALLDDSRALADRALACGVDVTLEVTPEMQHVFHFLAGVAPEADAAITRIAEWSRPRLGLDHAGPSPGQPGT